MSSIGTWIEGRITGICSSRSKIIASIRTDGSFKGVTIAKIQLEDSWATTRLRGGDHINVLLQDRQEGSTCFLNDKNSKFVIVNPSELVTVTDVAQGVRCQRRGALGAIFKSELPLTYPQFKGLVTHGYVEAKLKSDTISQEDDDILETVLRQHGTHVNSLTRVQWNTDMRRELRENGEIVSHVISRYDIFIPAQKASLIQRG